MTRLKRIFHILHQIMVAVSLGLWLNCPSTLAGTEHNVQAHQSQKLRFIKLTASGAPYSDQQRQYEQTPWSCVLDNQTQLIWEVKSNTQGLRNAQHTYVWFSSDRNLNGGQQGVNAPSNCATQPCNSENYVQAINEQRLCGLTQWRLPSREELRSLVDYAIKYPGPTIDTRYFPNAVNQFYWSSVPNANNTASAWGIGFSFGYDYAYFKSNFAYIRLVHGPDR